MTASVQRLPGVFPLHENKDFLRESEWVIFKLLCRSLDSLAEDDAESLSAATGGQVSVARCDELIRTIRISQLQGLGSWIARLLAESGLDLNDVRNLPSKEIIQRVNNKLGYPLCNEATVRALADLQLRWKGASAQEER